MFAPEYQPLQSMIADLRRKRNHPPIYDALERLRRIKSNLTCLRVLETHAPDTLPEGLTLAQIARDDLDLFAVTMDALDGILPLLNAELDLNGEYDDMDDGSHPLIIDPQGVEMSPEQFNEVVYDPTGYLERDDPVGSLLVFAMMLVNDYTEEAWEAVADWCGWPVISPPNSAGYDADHPREVADRLFKALDKDGLGVFVSVFKMAWWDTGSVFLDYCDQDAYTDPVEFTFENVERLFEQWAKAQPFLNDLETAKGMVESQPAVLKDVAKIWTKCCWANQRDRKRARSQRPQTLAELFTEAANHGEDHNG